jgi:hypothetical protein
MDMKKELQQVEINNNDSVLQIRNAMEKERDDLEKKIQIFKAIEIANAIIEMIKTDLEDLYEKNVYGIAISQLHDSDFDRHRFYFSGVDKNKNSVTNDRHHLIFNSKFMKIESLFSPYKGFGFAPESCNYGPDSHKFFMFSDNIKKEEILDFLLGDELKKIFDYNQMQLDLNSGNQVKPKSSKI